MTGGNFRLLHRLFVQIERILKIDGLSVVTDDVVEAARSTLAGWALWRAPERRRTGLFERHAG
jgi:hypothetical protein